MLLVNDAMALSILIVDDEIRMCRSLSEILCNYGHVAEYATRPREALTVIAEKELDLVLLDIRMPERSGLELLKCIKNKQYYLPVIIITGYPSIEYAVQSMKYGAADFLVKPLNIPALLKELAHIERATQHKNQLPPKYKIVTQNPHMLEVMKSLRKVAPSDAPVLITGESGTGKELAAHYLHYHSPRANCPFIKVNCASIPDTLLESDLFGHERGAYTDAHAVRKGKFELAHGGDIFFDEIGDMSLNTQAKILRVLQDGEFERLGGTDTIRTEARAINATNQDLEKLIELGRFREDLYYRLAVVTVHLPPLRERKEDILLLAEHFLHEFNGKYAKSIADFDAGTKAVLLNHSWPGNVRELRNCVERAVIFCEADLVGMPDLPAQYRSMPSEPEDGPLQALYDNLSRELILDALRKSKGVKKRAAEMLHVTRKTLYNRMKKLGLE
jgi:DNA-binding NtrC family response regulator